MFQKGLPFSTMGKLQRWNLEYHVRLKNLCFDARLEFLGPITLGQQYLPFFLNGLVMVLANFQYSSKISITSNLG